MSNSSRETTEEETAAPLSTSTQKLSKASCPMLTLSVADRFSENPGHDGETWTSAKNFLFISVLLVCAIAVLLASYHFLTFKLDKKPNHYSLHEDNEYDMFLH